ncbi:MAG: hypothetical protein H6679_01460 [Epsilonproteobacteria bacterium]|nr:hypothetical protein [Campylobacterota bacterium]
MIYPLFRSWQRALTIVFPAQLFSLFKQTITRLYSTLKVTFSHFSALAIGEVVLFLLVGDILLSKAPETLNGTASTLLLLMLSCIGAVSFVLQTSFLLLVRRESDDIIPSMLYLKVTFIQYIQLLFSLMLFSIFVLLLLSSWGITQYPTPPSGLLAAIAYLKLVTLFYWLDGTRSFSSFFAALEKAVNFVVYNAPLFLFAYGLSWLCQWVIHHTLLAGYSTETILHIVGSTQAASAANTWPPSAVIIIAARYLMLLVYGFEIALVFTMYRKYEKSLEFSSLFESNEVRS